MGRELARARVGWIEPRSDHPVAIRTRMWQWLGQDKAHNEAGLILAPSEQIVFSTRRHWLLPCKTILPMGAVMPVAFSVSVLLDVISDGLWLLQLVLWLGTTGHCVMIGYKIMAWRAELITVTDGGRIMRVQGVFDRHVSEHRLSGVTDVELHHTFPGRLFGYGTLRLESGGRHDEGSSREYLRFVPDAHRILALAHEHTMQTQFQQLVTNTVRRRG